MEEPSPVDTRIYYELPTLSIITDDSAPVDSKDNYVYGNITIKLDSASEGTVKKIKIKGRGNSTWGMPKKPYQIKFEDKESLLNMPEDKKWVLLANYTDKTMLRNETALEMGRMSVLSFTPESKFTELRLNDEFLGTYLATQKVEESSNRLKIGDDGYLLEVDQIERLDPDDVYFRTQNFLFNIKEPKLKKGKSKYDFIKNYLIETENSIFSDNFLDPGIGYRKYLDVEAFIDWYLINEITRNNDAEFYSSVYMNLIPGEKLKMGPIWDFDISLGNIDYNGNEKTEGFYMKNGKWTSRLFEDPEFVEQVKNRFEYFYSKKDEILQSIDKNADYLYASQVKNDNKWMTLGRAVWPNYVFFDTYQEEVDYLKNWYNERMDWLNTAFKDL